MTSYQSSPNLSISSTNPMVSPSNTISPQETVAPSPTTAKKSMIYIIFLLLAFLFLGVGIYLYNSESFDREMVIYSYVLMVIGVVFVIFALITGLNSPPTAPTSVTATPRNTSVTISFTGQVNCNFTVKSSSGTSYNGKSSPMIITGLTNGTAYIFTVTATNTFGTSASSSPTTSVTPLAVPFTPTGITAAPRAQSAIVTFTPTGTLATSFLVISSPGNFTQTGTVSPITVSGLTNGTSYRFTVRGINSLGQSESSVQSNAVVPIAIPAAPTSLVASARNASASLSFTTSTGATSYTVTSSPGGITATGPISPILVTGLTNNTSYTFTMRATNVSGTSAVSSASNAVVPSPGL